MISTFIYLLWLAHFASKVACAVRWAEMIWMSPLVLIFYCLWVSFWMFVGVVHTNVSLSFVGKASISMSWSPLGMCLLNLQHFQTNVCTDFVFFFTFKCRSTSDLLVWYADDNHIFCYVFVHRFRSVGDGRTSSVWDSLLFVADMPSFFNEFGLFGARSWKGIF